MDSVNSFVVSVNQALVSKKTIFRIPSSKLCKQIALFLRNQGYFSAVVLTEKDLFVIIRYVGSVTSLKRLVLISKPSKAVYFRASLVKNGVFLVSNSDSSLSLRTTKDFVGGKVLFQIL